MKATGIVRRIDELGRVVIPKEIRRTLRIREGDPLEIFTDKDGGIILKKYSPIGELGDFAHEYVEAMHQTFEHIALVSDKDTVIAVAGATKKEVEDKRVHEDVDRLLNGRDKCIRNAEDANLIAILDNEDVPPYTAQVLVPIIAGTDAIGSVILLSKEPGVTMGDAELKTCEAAANFLGKQMA